MRLQIIARDQLRGIHFFGGSFQKKLLDEGIVFQVAVAGQAIEAVQLQVLFKSRQAHKSLERRGAHLLHVLETHVIGHQRLDLLHLVI